MACAVKSLRPSGLMNGGVAIPADRHGTAFGITMTTLSLSRWGGLEEAATCLALEPFWNQAKIWRCWVLVDFA